MSGLIAGQSQWYGMPYLILMPYFTVRSREVRIASVSGVAMQKGKGVPNFVSPEN